MGVDVEFYQVIGLRGRYTKFKSYSSKTDVYYLDDLKTGDIDDYTCIVFEDNLPPYYEVISDGMCGIYSIIGKVIQRKVYLDEINDTSFTMQQLQKEIDEVYIELVALGIECEKDEIELITFCYFS